jgi:hypothetical protein
MQIIFTFTLREFQKPRTSHPNSKPEASSIYPLHVRNNAHSQRYTAQVECFQLLAQENGLPAAP